MAILTELPSTLWGGILDASNDRKMEFKGDRPLQLTMAALNTAEKSDDFVPVHIEIGESKKYLLCTLSKTSHVLQQQLAIEINAGETVTFSLGAANGSVHLSGSFLNQDDPCGDHDGEQAEFMKQLEKYSKRSRGGEDDDDDDDEDDDDEDEFDMDSDDDDDDEDDDDEDDDDEDDDDEEEEAPKNGKRKEIEAPKNDAKKTKKDDSKAPKLVPNEKPKQPEQAKKGAEQQAKKPTEAPKKPNEPTVGVTRTLQGEVIAKDTKIGYGPEARRGKTIQVYYKGTLKSNGKQFDACLTGKPFKFRLGAGEVIKGWDVGFENMKVGGKRTLIIPPHMAYGSRAMPGLPANSTLVFDVELKSVN